MTVQNPKVILLWSTVKPYEGKMFPYKSIQSPRKVAKFTSDSIARTTTTTNKQIENSVSTI